jgi:predicted chitinase
MTDNNQSYSANPNQKVYDMPHFVDHEISVIDIFFAEQIKKYKSESKSEEKTILKNKKLNVFLENYKNEKENKHKLNISVAQNTKADLKKGDKITVNWQVRVDDGFEYKKINNIVIGKKLFVKAICSGDKEKLTIEIYENKQTNTEAVYDSQVKFLIGEDEKTKIEFDIKAFQPNFEYVQEITLKPKGKDEYKTLVDKFNKRKDKNAFLYLKATVAETISYIKFAYENNEFCNLEKTRLEVLGSPCYCNRDLTVDEMEELIITIRKNSFYKADGKSYPMYKLHGKKLFFDNANNCKYYTEVVEKKDQTIDNLTTALNFAFSKYEINTCIKKMHFLSQMFVETQWFTRTIEGDNGYTDKYDPYRGRGFIQITGEYNYKKYSNDKKNSIADITGDNKSKVATNLKIGADTSGWFWRYGSLINGTYMDINEVASQKDVSKVTRRINPALKHLKERSEAFDAIIKIINYEDTCINKI